MKCTHGSGVGMIRPDEDQPNVIKVKEVLRTDLPTESMHSSAEFYSDRSPKRMTRKKYVGALWCRATIVMLDFHDCWARVFCGKLTPTAVNRLPKSDTALGDEWSRSPLELSPKYNPLTGEVTYEL